MESNNQSLINLPKLTWEDWQVKYRPHIRVAIVWDAIQKPRPKVWRTWLFEDYVDDYQFGEPEVFYPWYGRKNWRNGKKERVDRKNFTDSIVVAPAVAYQCGTHIMLLDGCHRIKYLRPRLIILDCIEPVPAHHVYFNDLIREE